MAADIVMSKLNFLGGFDDYLCRDRVAGCWNLVILNGADSPSSES